MKHGMTINDYLRLEAPHTVQAVIQSKEETKTIKKDFVMKQANQIIVFTTGLMEEEIAAGKKQNPGNSRQCPTIYLPIRHCPYSI